MEISTQEIPLQPWGEDVDSGYVLFPVLDRPGEYVAQFSDGSFAPYWVPKGAELDAVPFAEAPPRMQRLAGCFSAEQLLVFGSVLTMLGALGGALS